MEQGNSYPVIVNYGLSLEEMIRAGKYDYVDPNITTDYFSVEGEGIKKVMLELICFNRRISSDDALSEFDKCKRRPAIIEELLAFGAKYPELQGQSMTIALGSIICNHPRGFNVPYISASGTKLHMSGKRSPARMIIVCRHKGEWCDDALFLVARQ